MKKENLVMNALVLRACVMENLSQACGRLVVGMWACGSHEGMHVGMWQACGRHVEGMYVAALTE